MIRLACVLSLLLATPALADRRLETRRYDAAEVVTIKGRVGIQATVVFGDDEHIENVAVGDSTRWQVTPNKRANLLFVKPLTHTARTNMTVVTDRYTYLFDLIASKAAAPLYVLRFTYPAPPPKVAITPAPTLTSSEQAATSGPSPVDPARLNFAWVPKGAQALLPQRVWDDGIATYLTWRADRPVPAILIVDAAGKEGPVNYAVQSDTIVVDGVPAQLVLRSGRAVASLTHARPAAPPALAASGKETRP